jgi:signal transduction histidine kinase
MALGTELSGIAAVAVPTEAASTDQLRAQLADDASWRAESRDNLEPSVYLLLPLAIFTATWLAVEFSHHSNFVVTLWPTNAIILVALLRYAPNLRNYGTILLGGACAIVLASVVSGNGLKFTVILVALNIVETALTWALLSVFRIGAANLTSFRNLLKFIIIAGMVAPIGTNAVSAMMIGSAHGIPWHSVWLHTYPAHGLGMIVVAPFLISVTSPNRQPVPGSVREMAAIVAFAIAVAMCAAFFRSVIFLIVPIILLSTMRFGMIGATASNLAVATFTSIIVGFGVGSPLIERADLADRILVLQVMLTFTSFWCLPIAALLQERDQLLHDLSLANSQLKQESETQSHLVVGLRRHLSIAEEKERLRLSYELHDEAGQGLIAAILELNEIDALIVGAARERLQLVRKKMEDLGKTLHRIAWELRPPSIDELGLRKALTSYVAEWGERCSTEVDFHCDDPQLDTVPSEIGTAVYRIVQEGLTNIVKHAGHPSDVSIVIRRVAATLQVIIEDNGCGFDAGAMSAKPGAARGLGLAGMRERLTLIGGTLEIESAVGAGTTIFARIALDGQRSAA